LYEKVKELKFVKFISKFWIKLDLATFVVWNLILSVIKNSYLSKKENKFKDWLRLKVNDGENNYWTIEIFLK
jgi:hypothetical protein